MKFITISPLKDVRKSDIIAIDYVDEMSCKLTTSTGTFNCLYPRWRVLMLLEQEDIENQIAAQPQSPIDRTNLFGAQHWAG